MKTEFTAQDEIDLLHQIMSIKDLPTDEAGSRFTSNSWLIEDEANPRTVFFTFQTLTSSESPNVFYQEGIKVSVNKELIDVLRENFHQTIGVVSSEYADKLWNVVYNDNLELFWCNASGGSMSICDGIVALTVTTVRYDPKNIPGDNCAANASEASLIQTMRRCRTMVDIDGSELNFGMTIPDPRGDINVVFAFLSYKNPETAASLPITERLPYDESPAFARLGMELGFLSPFAFTEISSDYIYPTGQGQGDVDGALGDDFVLLRSGDSALKVTFSAFTPVPSKLS